MNGRNRSERDDILHGESTTRRDAPSCQTASRVSYAPMAMAGILALLGLSVELGCGSANSASPESSAKSNASSSAQPEGSTPTTDGATSSASPEESPADPTEGSSEAASSTADATGAGPVTESPVNQRDPAAEDASAPPASGESSDNVVPPSEVALASGEQSPASSQKPQAGSTGTGGAGDPNRVHNYSFDDLKFDIEKDAPFERSMLPKKIEGYAGQKVSIRGFILPTSFQTGLTSFVLVRDNMECCFGPGAALYDCIVVQMAEGKSTDYSIRPVTVEGRFSIDEVIGPGRRHLAIYKIVADKVE